jgi:ferredoxin-NADP reductase
LYSNRTPKDAPFLDELSALAKENKNFTFVPTMTALAQEPWDGERGYIDAPMLKRHMPEGQPVYYLAGPAAMVKAMREVLSHMGVSGDDIRTEEFTGY